MMGVYRFFRRLVAVLVSFCLLCLPAFGCIRSYASDISAFDSLESYVDEGNLVDDDDAVPYVRSASDAFMGASPDVLSADTPMLLVAGVDDAFIAVCALVFAACGVVVSGENLKSMADDFYYFIKERAADFTNALKVCNDVRGYTVGATVTGVSYLIRAAKAYFKQLPGYGTAQTVYRPYALSLSCPQSHEGPEGYLYYGSFKSDFNSTCDNFNVYDVFFERMPLCAYLGSNGSNDALGVQFISGLNGTSKLSVGFHVYKSLYRGFLYKGFDHGSHDSNARAGYRYFLPTFPFPIFKNFDATSYYCITGQVRDASELVNPGLPGITISKPIIDAQTADVNVVGDPALTIPETALLEQLLADVVTKDDLANALKDIVPLTYAGDVVLPTVVPTVVPTAVPTEGPDVRPSESESEGVDVPPLPWVPDITGRLDGLLDGLTGLGDRVLGGLDDIVDGVRSIPGTITDALAGVNARIASIADALNPSLEQQTIPDVVMTRFPFCIPFDLIDCFRTFNATAVEPRWEIPLVIPSIGFRYVFVLDLTQFTTLVLLIRAIALLSYIAALAMATRSLIKG